MFESIFMMQTLLPALLVALTAGILSFSVSCVLPIVPPYLAHKGGISLDEAKVGAATARCLLRRSSSWACRPCFCSGFTA